MHLSLKLVPNTSLHQLRDLVIVSQKTKFSSVAISHSKWAQDKNDHHTGDTYILGRHS